MVEPAAMSSHPSIEQLVGAEISSVVFIRDYVQITFERQSRTRDARLSIYGRSTVLLGDVETSTGNTNYASTLVRCIDRIVEAVETSRDAFVLHLSGGMKITIHVDEKALVEAAALNPFEGPGVVWRPGDPGSLALPRPVSFKEFLLSMPDPGPFKRSRSKARRVRL
jgi:hypothetical protein